MEEEYLDLVDENDNVIGRKARSEIYAAKFSNFRVINVFLINSKGQIWTPRRTADKRIFPLALDFSAAGHVSAGDTYDETFAREVQEELNIDVAKMPHRMLGYIKPTVGRPRQFMQVYEMQSDETPDYNQGDFIEWWWLTPQEILDRIAAGDYAKGDLPVLLKRFYL